MGITVVKIGGSVAEEAGALLGELAVMKQVVIVHGGAAKVTEIAERMGKPQRFVESVSGFRSRFTDRESARIFTMVTCGMINKSLVEGLQAAGSNALGISGADGGLLRAKRKDVLRVVEDGREKILRGDYSGKVERVNAGLLNGLLGLGVVPVIAPVALSRENALVTMDADRGAAAIAGALGAERLVVFTDVDGFFRNFPNDLVREISGAKELEGALANARGGMKKKLLAAQEALAGGVKEVILANARAERPLHNALQGERRTVVRG